MTFLQQDKRMIKSTRVYEQFKFLPGNRPLDPRKVRSIKHDIKEGFNMLPYQPVNVTKDMFIIDGQHRFTVSKDLKEPVYYIVVPDIKLTDIAKLNSRSSSWKPMDFVNCFCTDGNQDYNDLRIFIEKYKWTVSDASKIVMTGSIQTSKNTNNLVRTGRFKATHLTEAYELANFIEQFDFIEYRTRRLFIRVMEKIKSKGTADVERLKVRLKEDWEDIELRGSDWMDLLNQIERSYNFKKQERQTLA